tara:strand:- start:2704 stop:3642 length:939 start_codon:yes stop_codon:yes gene_type:complete
MKWLRSENYSIPILLAVGLHLSIIVAGVVVIDFSDNAPQQPKRPHIVNATVIDISQTIIGKRESEEKAAKQQQAALSEKKRKEAEQNQKKEAERKALEDKQKKVAQAKQIKEKAAEALQKSNEKKRDAEQKRIAQETEKKRLDQVADKKRLAKEAQVKEQLSKELIRKAEAERVAIEERKRQEEAARLAEQKKAEEEAAQAAAEEAKKRAAEEAQMVQSIGSIINDRLSKAWNRPPSARNGMKTTLKISFLPSGEVLDVNVSISSGDALFDRNTVNAARKIKVEELSQIDPYVFNKNFRNIIVIFNPQDLRN